MVDLSKVIRTPPHDIHGKEVSQYLPKGEGAEILIRIMEVSKEVFKEYYKNK